MRVRAVAFDLMDTVVRDPYREALEAATGRPLRELFARRSPTAYPAFERDELTEDEYWAAFADAGIAVDPQVFHEVRLANTRWLPGMRELLDDLDGVVARVTASNYPRWVDGLADTHLAGAFDRVVASCHLGVRKPDPGFFEGLLGLLELVADEVLFVDDREDNVVAAREVGITAHRFVDAAELRRWLRAHDVPVRGGADAGGSPAAGAG